MGEELYMRRALELALHGAGSVAPNPMVAAVLVHEGCIIGEGWHALYGDVHAEVACLQSVAPDQRHLIRESTMYVTLEPCAHQGKQPPCADRLAREGIRRLVGAMDDPFPQVAGRGFRIVQEAGVELARNMLNQEARWMSRRFLSVHERGRPYIVLKWAQSADAYIAPADGSRYQLSNGFSQTLVHQWRTQESAIMVGYNTALADNPRLNARAWKGPQPLRIVLDRALKLPASHHLFDGSQATWIVNEQQAKTGSTSYIKLPFDEQLLPALLERLAAAGRTSLFVEGGAHLLQSFIKAGLWDEARVFKAPASLGGGIAAPQLSQGVLATTWAVGDDELLLYCNSNARYPYPLGAIL